MNAPVPPDNRPATGHDVPALTLGDVLEIIRRHRAAAFATGLVIAVVVLVYGLVRTPLYEASATIALERTRRPTDTQTDAQLDPRLGIYEHDLLNTQRNILLSGNLLKVALKTGGLMSNTVYAESSEPLEQLRERINVTTSRDSWDLVITLRDEVPARAEAALLAILDAYRSRHLQGQKERADSAISFLEDQVAEAQRKMEQTRESQQSFQRTNNLTTLDVERSLPAQRLQAFNSKKVVLTQQISALEVLVNQVNSIDTTPDADQRLDKMLTLDLVNRHPTVAEQLKLLYQLKTEEAQLTEKYLEKHPRMIEMQNRITTKRQHLDQAVEAVRQGVLSDFIKLNAQLENLGKDIARGEAEFNTYRENLFTLQTRIIETRAAELQYESLLRRLNDERVQQRIEVQQLSVVDSPRVASLRPVNIRFSLTVALALVLGGASVIAVPLLIEFLGRRAHDPNEIRALLGAPVLAELPYVSHLAVLGANGNPDQDPKLAESFRGLRAALKLTHRGDNRGEVLLITSCDTSEGKSTITARLAVSMALAGLRVLVVDGDLRRPALREQLGQASERGLSQLLAGEPGISPASTTYPNLDLLDAGTQVSNPGELLSSHCLPEWLEQCRERYDYILIDSPPMRWFADALVIGHHCDRLLLVVREGSTQRSSLAKVRAQLAPLEGKPLGTVIVGPPAGFGRLALYGHEPYTTTRRPTIPASAGVA